MFCSVHLTLFSAPKPAFIKKAQYTTWYNSPYMPISTGIEMVRLGSSILLPVGRHVERLGVKQSTMRAPRQRLPRGNCNGDRSRFLSRLRISYLYVASRGQPVTAGGCTCLSMVREDNNRKAIPEQSRNTKTNAQHRCVHL